MSSASFDELYRTEFARVVAIARRIVADAAEAEDIAQDVFAALAARTHAEASPGWLHTAAVRRALKALRSRRRRAARELRATVLTAAADGAEHTRLDPLDALVRDERREAIRSVMRRLKQRDAALLALRYGGELSYREIAATLELPPPHVGTLIGRAERAFVREVRRAPRVVALALAATIACLLAVMAFPAARSYATSLLEELRPARLIAQVVRPHQPAGLGEIHAYLSPFATYHWNGRSKAPPRGPFVASLSEAERWTGFRVRVPALVPDGLVEQRRAYVMAGGSWTYRFDRTRAARHGAHLPRALDGATLTAAFGTYTELRYGDGRVRDALPGFTKPVLVVLEAAAPVVTVRGTTLPSIARWMETDPGVPPRAAAEVRRFADPLLSLPVPIRAERDHAAHVVVQGVPGIAVSTLFGVSTIVVWQKDGMVYAVGGTYPADRVLAIANSLR